MLYGLLDRNAAWLDELGLFRFFQVFYQLEFRAFSAVVLSFIIVMIIGPRIITWLMHQKVGDQPEFYNRKLNTINVGKEGTPTMGGLMIAGSILLTIFMLADLNNRYVWYAVLVLLWLSTLGAVDDWLKLTSARRNPGSREGLFAWEKLLFQLGIGLIIGWALYRHGLGSDTGHVLTLPFQRTYVPGTLQLEDHVIELGFIAFALLTMLFIAGTSNAVNLADGMDGLVAGTMVIASFALMVLCYVAGHPGAAEELLLPYVKNSDEIMVITGSMAGACLGFLWFNCSPARVFMGDTGSLPLGGLLAFIAIAIRQEVLLLIIGFIYFVEMASVILQVGYFKATGGRRIFRVAPIHHHFHLGGWSEQQVVVRFWLIGVIAAMIALVSIKIR